MRNWVLLTLSLALILTLLGFALVGPRTVFLSSGGKLVVRATEPAGLPRNYRVVTFSVGRSNVFGVWKDFDDSPLLVYAFPDAKRYLCIYDDDTAILTFVVDCGGPGTNIANQPKWPPDGYARKHLERRMTNVVVNAQGVVRLPTYAEAQEVSSNVTAWTPRQFHAACFPDVNLGLYQHRLLNKESALLALNPSRHSVWPTKENP